MMKLDLNAYGHCQLCPRRCGIDRASGQLGFCKAPAEVAIATYQVHRFEEPPISGYNGSGTIFFSFCTARCAYCQNYNFSRGEHKRTISVDELSDIMLGLQAKNCHNINLVTPTHYAPSIALAVKRAKANGLSIPIVYNTSGYETVEVLKALNGLIDIYLPDAKYSVDVLAKEHCGFIDYSMFNIKALIEMFSQVGNLETDSKGVAIKGLIIRHLVLPGYLGNTKGVLKAISENISKDVYISLMNQYSPLVYNKEHPSLSRRLSATEYEKAKSFLEEFGLSNGWVQK